MAMGDTYDRDKVSPRFEVVKTLLRGKQSPKKFINAKGEVKINFHGLPQGYVLKDLWNNKLIAVSHLEAPELILKYGGVNVIATMTYCKDSKTGARVPSPYIRASAGHVALQDPSFIVNPDTFLREHPEIEVTEELKEILKKKTVKSTRKTQPKYSPEDILAAVRNKRKRLGLGN